MKPVTAHAERITRQSNAKNVNLRRSMTVTERLVKQKDERKVEHRTEALQVQGE